MNAKEYLENNRCANLCLNLHAKGDENPNERIWATEIMESYHQAKSKEEEIELHDLVISELDANTVSWRGANVILSEHYERIAENVSEIAAFGKEER